MFRYFKVANIKTLNDILFFDTFCIPINYVRECTFTSCEAIAVHRN